jgi:NAD(P)H-nitrite reductase large subunit
MKPDDKICYCYGVTMRKLVNYARRVRPHQPSRMTECLNAGTGCGWCIPFLVKIARNPDAFDLEELTPEQYAERRKSYIQTEPRNTFEQPGAGGS